MIKISKGNVEYDVEEKSLSLWIAKGFKKVEELKSKFEDEETEDESPKRGRNK